MSIFNFKVCKIKYYLNMQMQKICKKLTNRKKKWIYVAILATFEQMSYIESFLRQIRVVSK